jgi:Zn-dependent protease/CBS domain-containing protein
LVRGVQTHPTVLPKEEIVPPAPRRFRFDRVRLAGIDVNVHWTFLLMLGWIFATHVLAGHGVAAALAGVALMITVFVCVVLHELGHALTARRFGVRTLGITLYPIGGVARFERMPERPVEELWISLAGPAVNFAIAGALWLAIDRVPGPASVAVVGGSFLAQVMYINLSLALFNLLPAFPMDGGRVLRALLAMRTDYVRATQIAATAGKHLAVLLGLAGFFYNPFLVLIAVFVYMTGQQEAQMVRARAELSGTKVTDAMLTRFHSLDGSEPVARAESLLLHSDQEEFPVLHDGVLAGMVSRQELLGSLATGARDRPVKDLLAGSLSVAEASEPLEAAVGRMQQSGRSALPVVREGRLVGLITLDHLRTWLTTRAVLRGPPSASPDRAGFAGSVTPPSGAS